MENEHGHHVVACVQAPTCNEGFLSRPCVVPIRGINLHDVIMGFYFDSVKWVSLCNQFLCKVKRKELGNINWWLRDALYDPCVQIMTCSDDVVDLRGGELFKLTEVIAVSLS